LAGTGVKMAQEQKDNQVYPCHVCGEPIEGTLYVLMLPTQVRRPTPEDTSRYVTTRYQFCARCLCSYAYRFLTQGAIENFLDESQNWKHPTGSDDIVWKDGDIQLPTLTRGQKAA
jgi:hypothetical protein